VTNRVQGVRGGNRRPCWDWAGWDVDASSSRVSRCDTDPGRLAAIVYEWIPRVPDGNIPPTGAGSLGSRLR